MKQHICPRRSRLTIILLFVSLAWANLPARVLAALQPVALRCEYRVNPLGIDETQPRLTWRVESRERGQRQTAYQILVASTEAALKKNVGDLWDSGRVASDQTVNIAYAGQPLVSRQACFWKVRVWDKHGKGSAWSPPARWTMGLLEAGDWQADYISHRDATPVHKDAQSLFLPPARQFRREFTAPKRVQRATAYATALGIYELYLNGQRVGDAWFAPGWTDYHERAYYWTYDVTPLVTRGANAVGVWLADGWYSGYIGFGLLTGIGTEKIGRYTYGKTPAFRAQLEIEYTDGLGNHRDRCLVENHRGRPIREADFLMGEYYDARREQPGWTRAGFDDRDWEAAIAAADNGPQPATFYEWQNADQPDGKIAIKGHPVDLAFHAPPKLEAFPGCRCA